MIRRSVRVTPVIAALLLTTASAQQPAPPPFRFERPVVAGGAGPRRLAIDVPLLAGGEPFQVVSSRIRGAAGETSATATGGLGDLRLFDTAGREIGYLLVPNPPDEPAWKPAAILPIASVDTPTAKSSGFEADLGEAYTVDRFRIDGLPPPFLKRVQLEGSGDRAHWTLLVAEGTVFDLPDERLRQTEITFKQGSFRYLRVTWDDTSSGRLPRPSLAVARQVRTAVAPPPLTTALAFERRPSEPGRSRFRIRLPGSHLPIVALDLDVGGGHLLREASLFEARLSGSEAVPTLLGRGTLGRVVQGTLTASSLRVPMSPPLEPELDFVVEDGDNPPLDLRGVTAIVAELPWIYFESDGSALAARYGNPTLAAPRYDLEAVRASLKIDSMPDAAWGPARTRTSEENATGPTPTLPVVGASLDSASFRYLRAIPPGDAGLVALSLDAAALAHSAAADFADLRVIDAAGRQVPYLVERASEPLSIDLSLERLTTPPKAWQPSRSTRSFYRAKLPFAGLKLPSAGLPAFRLVLTSSARVFRRQVTVGVEREPDRQRRDPWIETVADAAWVHADQDRPTPALTLPLRFAGATELLVIVEEGDNSPLPLDSARLLLPAYRLRLFRERGASLRLAYGRDDLQSPHYDLALLASQVLGVAATEVAPGAEQQSPAATATAALLSPRLFWGVLIAAVVVLLALIVRLVRKEDATASP